MGKVSLALIVGLVLAGLLLFFLDEGAEQMPPTEFVANEAPHADSMFPESTLSESSRSNAPGTAEVRGVAESVATGEGVRPIAEEESSGSEPPPPSVPITLPAEFDWLSSDPSHQSFEREAIDPVWSFNTEAQINRFFAEHPEIISKYGFPTIHCRTTRCRVLITAYGIDESSLVREFGRSLNLNSDYSKRPWVEQFEFGTIVTNSQDGVTTLSWVLSKRE